MDNVCWVTLDLGWLKMSFRADHPQYKTLIAFVTSVTERYRREDWSI